MKLWEISKLFSSPFLGTFFQWKEFEFTGGKVKLVFVPFLGDFLSIAYGGEYTALSSAEFSSPFLGTFFQLEVLVSSLPDIIPVFSSPFLGTFFQYDETVVYLHTTDDGFRPLSWGLSFNMIPRSSLFAVIE